MAFDAITKQRMKYRRDDVNPDVIIDAIEHILLNDEALTPSHVAEVVNENVFGGMTLDNGKPIVDRAYVLKKESEGKIKDREGKVLVVPWEGDSVDGRSARAEYAAPGKIDRLNDLLAKRRK